MGAVPGVRAAADRVRVSTSLAEINVVPLVDVMLVLLIIFMVAAPMMTQGMAVNLPQARRVDAAHGAAALCDDSRVVRPDAQVQIDNDEVDSAFLPSASGRRCWQRSDKSLFVRSDGAVTVQQFITVTRQAERRRAWK